jgi:3-methyladenine DNA glycosylase AlkD
MGQVHMITAKDLRARLGELGDRQKAQFLQGFFKTGPGGYGEGDVFLGIRVPELRKLVSEHKTLTPSEVLPLLQSPVHEERLIALLVLVRAFSKGDGSAREEICGMYLENTRYINNWDLVDLSAPHIVGAFLMDRSREPLYRLAQSPTLWERRIAVMATFHFIRHNQFSDTLKISRLLLSDQEDLIHKAVGWMLREVGKRNLASEEAFLNEHCRQMPRTMLRYAIERFPEARRRMYLEGTI